MRGELFDAIRQRCGECQHEECAVCPFGQYRSAIKTMNNERPFKAYPGIRGGHRNPGGGESTWFKVTNEKLTSF